MEAYTSPPRLLRFDSRRFGPPTETRADRGPPPTRQCCCASAVRGPHAHRLTRRHHVRRPDRSGQRRERLCAGDIEHALVPLPALRCAPPRSAGAGLPYSRHPAAAAARRGLSGYTIPDVYYYGDRHRIAAADITAAATEPGHLLQQKITNPRMYRARKLPGNYHRNDELKLNQTSVTWHYLNDKCHGTGGIRNWNEWNAEKVLL